MKHWRFTKNWYFLGILLLLTAGCMGGGGTGGSGTYNISGTITYSNGDAMPPVVVNIGDNDQVITNQEGTFAVGNLTGPQVIRPEASHHLFVPRSETASPSNRTFSFIGLLNASSRNPQPASGDFVALDSNVVVDFRNSGFANDDWISAPATTTAPFDEEMTVVGSVVNVDFSRSPTASNFLRIGFVGNTAALNGTDSADIVVMEWTIGHRVHRWILVGSGDPAWNLWSFRSTPNGCSHCQTNTRGDLCRYSCNHPGGG